MADLARQYMVSNPEDLPKITASVASRIETGHLKFLDFIASVQEYAVDDDLTIQAKSIGYIAAVLALLKPDTLPRREISVLVAFLRTRIEDNAGAKEASQALRSLMEMNRFIKQDSVEIMDSLFKNTTDLQRQPAAARFAIYQLVEKSLERCREVLEGMGNRFIDGVLSLVEFEKDPRNLMVVFSFLRVVMAEFAATESQTAALWDAVFRYYPISYRPKPEDKIQITKQDLQQRLEACLTSNSRFAPFAFPSLLSKLDQEIGATVKVETLKCVSSCIMAYNLKAVLPFVHKTWSLVKFDVYSQVDVSLAMEAAKVLRNLVTKTFEQEDGIQQHELVKLVTKEIMDNMEAPTEELARKASLIVTAVASGSSVAFSLVLQSIMPALLTIYQDVDGKIAETTALLKLFNRILDDADFKKGSTFYDPSTFFWETRTQIRAQKIGCITTLERFREKLIELFDMALRQQENSIRVVSLQGLVKLAQVPNFLSYEEIGMVVQSLSEFALIDEDKLRSEAIEGLKKISSIKALQIRGNLTNDSSYSPATDLTHTSHDGAELIELIVFPAMVRATALSTDINYPEFSRLDLVTLKENHMQAYLSWATMSSEVKVFSAFLKSMKEQLQQALNWYDSDFTNIVLLGIKSGLEKHITSFKRFSGGLKFPLNSSPVDYVQFVKELFKLVVLLDQDTMTIITRDLPHIRLEDTTLQLIGSISTLVFRSVEVAQSDAANELFSLFVADGVEVDKNALGSSNILLPKDTVVLTKCLLASFRPDPKLLAAYDLNKIAANIVQAVKLHGEASSDGFKVSVSEILGILVNKFEVGKITTESKDVSLDTVMRSLLVSCFSKEKPMSIQRALPVVFLILQYTIAMVKKGGDEIYSTKENDAAEDTEQNAKLPFLKFLITFFDVNGGDVLEDGEKSIGGDLMATLFGQILDKQESTLTKKNHAIVKADHRKKFYTQAFPALLEFMDSHPNCPSSQKNCLVALTGIINHISDEEFVLKTNPITLMLRVLDLEVEGQIKRAALELMISAARNNPAMLSDHYNSVINRLTSCMEDSDHVVRALAIHCTACLALTIEEHVNLPYKRRVLRRLGLTVGDSDARVRSEAVDCRMKWFNIDEPSDE